MVSTPASKRSAAKLGTQSRVLFGVLLAILLVAVMLTIYIFVKYKTDVIVENDTIVEPKESASQSSEKTEVKPEKIDFQLVVDAWIKSVNGNKSVLIYDLDREEIVGKYDADAQHETASLYKLFVVYEGYRRLENDEWGAVDVAGRTGHTIIECLDLAIRESNSICAETLYAMIGYDELEEIVKNDFNITNTSVEDLASNANDIARIMKLFYDHPDIKNTELIARMKDSFLNQPITEYNWRQGLPSGFSDNARIYNKAGWSYNEDEKQWDIYNDASIVEFPEANRHFVVVIMTNRVPYQKIREFGTMIEDAFYDNQ